MTNRTRTTIVLLTTLTLLFGVTGAFASDADAQKVYNSKCKMCHAEDGSGDTKMGEKLKVADLSSPEVQAKTDDELAETITDGKNKMPKFGKKLSAEEIEALVAYIRKLASP